MKLSTPISIKPPEQSKPIILKELHLLIIDNSITKCVKVLIRPFTKPITLWENQQYTDIGDYTQAQVEDRVLEILGDNPAEKLMSLYVPNKKV